MDLISLVVVIIAVGVILYLVNSFIPMDSRIKQLLNVVVIIAIVIWVLMVLLNATGVGDVRVG